MFRLLHRKNEIYSFSWNNDVDFDRIYIMAAPFGGPIAMTKDVLKSDFKPIINVLSASGQRISVLRVNIILIKLFVC